MKIHTLITIALLSLTAPAATALTDTNTTLSATQADKYTVRLGPGALGTLTFPEAVTDVTFTRSGLIETKVIGNRVLLVGLVSHGSTPMIITTETATYTWRAALDNKHAGSIVNITVQDDEATSVQSAPASPVAAAPTTTVRPRAAVAAQDAPSFTFSMTRDGGVLIVNYRVQAGAKAVALDERQLSVIGPGGTALVKSNLTTLVVAPGTTRYGTVTASAADAGGAPLLNWPYRVGLTQATAQHKLTLP